MNRKAAVLAMVAVAVLACAHSARASAARGGRSTDLCSPVVGVTSSGSVPAVMDRDGHGAYLTVSGQEREEGTPLYKARPPLDPRERPQAVPEPLTLVLLGIGLACIGLLLGRKTFE